VLQRPGASGESLPDLIARQEYGRAIELLTEELDRTPATLQSRLQLADLLALAGRGAEAVPVFEELAREYAEAGFISRAIAMLKRVDQIAPSPDVDARLAELVREQRRLAAEVKTLPPGEDPDATVAFGTDDPRTLAPGDVSAAGGDGGQAPPPEATDEEGAFDDALTLPPVPMTRLLQASHGETDDKVGERIRRVFKRFVANLPAGEEGVEGEEPPLVVEESELQPLPTPPRRGADALSPALSEEAFQGRLLDLVQRAVSRPTEGSLEGETLEPSRRLLATPLFKDLDEDELLAVVRGLKLRVFAPGDVILTEGETSDRSMFVISAGRVKVFVRNPTGRNMQLGQLEEGDFFGEIAGMSGQARTATITAGSRCELLELERATLDSIARRHPRVRRRLEELFVERAGSPEAAAVRAVPLSEEDRLRCSQVLTAHFGSANWDPKVRLRLAKLLMDSGKVDEAVPVLVSIADELSREGYTEKAIAVIKKVEQIRRRHIREINLAPLHGEVPAPEPGEPAPAREPEAGAEAFQSWLIDVVRDRVKNPAPWVDPEAVATAGFKSGLRASPLFAGFTEEELLELVCQLRLRHAEPGDVLITEGEQGAGVFIVCEGRVRVFVRSSIGHDTELCELGDGAFFGEMSTLLDRPRSATVTAVAACDLLELDRGAIELLTGQHPRVRRVLDEFVAARSHSPHAARIRRGRAPRGDSR
jgi:CRP-like cAMP-binding protein